MAAGKICIGFSKPYVAKYTANGNTVTFSDGMELARGVSVELAPEFSADENSFYANNRKAESVSGTMTGYGLTLTVDGLKIAAERMVMGLPAAANGWTPVGGASQNQPYIAVGWIAKYMEDGRVSYVPTVAIKTKFNPITLAHATQEEEIDWQTQEITATGMRSDSAEGEFYAIGDEVIVDGTTIATNDAGEQAAEAALKAYLGIAA